MCIFIAILVHIIALEVAICLPTFVKFGTTIPFFKSLDKFFDLNLKESIYLRLGLY